MKPLPINFSVSLCLQVPVSGKNAEKTRSNSAQKCALLLSDLPGTSRSNNQQCCYLHNTKLLPSLVLIHKVVHRLYL